MILLDTSGLLSLYHRSELHHSEAARIVSSTGKIVTHNLVLAEFVPLAHSRGFPRRQTLDAIRNLFANPMVDVMFIGNSLHDEGIDLLQKRMDKTWSLCDAVSFVLMKQLNITEALTTDHHFEQAGFIRLLK